MSAREKFYAALLATRPGEWSDPLEGLLARPEWHQRAACRGAGTDAFYPSRGQRPGPARELCARCPVIEDCAEAGRAEEYGIWGGLSERARRAIRPPRTATARTSS